jgi:hypothetical protein
MHKIATALRRRHRVQWIQGGDGGVTAASTADKDAVGD